jgi:hypothetical protein
MQHGRSGYCAPGETAERDRCHAPPKGNFGKIIFKRNTPQLAAAGIKGMRIQFRLRSAWPGSNFMRQRLGCPAACGVGALPPFRMKNPKN